MGYEINPFLVAYSRLRSLQNANETFQLRSLWDADMRSAQLVYVYALPFMMDELQAKLSHELPAGAHVISSKFPFPADPSCVPRHCASAASTRARIRLSHHSLTACVLSSRWIEVEARFVETSVDFWCNAARPRTLIFVRL